MVTFQRFWGLPVNIMTLTKSQKIIILFSGVWAVICLLIAGGISSNSYDEHFSTVAFLSISLILSSPILVYWAGVWIWGFGYILRCLHRIAVLIKARFLSKKALILLCEFLAIIFLAGAVAFLFKTIAIDVPPILIALLVGFILNKYHKRREEKGQTESLSQALIMFLVASLSCIGGYYGVAYLRQQNAPEALMAAMEKQYPAYITLQTKEPEVYRKIKDVVIAGVKQNKTAEEINNSIQPILADYEKKKLPYVSDEILVRSVKADLNAAKELSHIAPEKCFNLLIGKPTGYVNNIIKQETLNEEMSVFNDVVIAPRIENPTIATAEESRNLVAPILIKESTVYNMPIDDIAKVFAGSYDPNRSCNYLLAVTQDLIALPTKTAAPIIRSGVEK